MRRRRDTDLHRSQKSVWFPMKIEDSRDVGLRSMDDVRSSLYVGMLVEDVALYIMPWTSVHGEKDKFRVSLNPADDRNEKLVSSALAGASYHGDLTSTTCDFIRDCARAILTYGEATFEIVFLSKPDSGEIIGFEFVYIPYGTVLASRDEVVQLVPPSIAKAQGLPEHIPLDPERIVSFRPPKSLNDKLRHIVTALVEISNYMIPPEFYVQDLQSGSKSVPYDLATHMRAQKLALAAATKPIGWNARYLLGVPDMLEFYVLYRQLAFHRFVIELRDAVVDTLNEALGQANREFDFRGLLELQGHTTVADVEEAQHHLQEGDRPFKTMLEPFLRS